MPDMKKFLKQRAKDAIYSIALPAVYNKYRKASPVDERKVLFVEYHTGSHKDSFRLLYHELNVNYDFDLHFHALNAGGDTKDFLDRSRRMLADMATAKYVFICEPNEVISCIKKRPETKVIQLWHACGAFKKFGLSTVKDRFGAEAKAWKRHPYYGNLDYVTVSSPEVIEHYADAMDLKHPLHGDHYANVLPADKYANILGKQHVSGDKATTSGDASDIIKPVGVSRTDVFFNEKYKHWAKQKLNKLFPAAAGQKVILYAPTFRGKVGSPKAPDKLDVAALGQALSDEYVLVIKQHPLVKDAPAVPQEWEGTFARDLTEDMSIQELLCCADICISDYSSLVFEYSLFEKPMLFFAYDKEDYDDWQGFYYSYDEMTPGPVLTSNVQLIDEIVNIRTRFDVHRVRAFREKFMSACDGHATQRILEMTFGDETLKAHRKSADA